MSTETLRLFAVPVTISIVSLFAVFLWGGAAALMTAALLCVLEVTLSFDNAVVNARILKQMSEQWQKRFLTWGILLAVFGTRLVLPIVIVSVIAWTSPFAIASLAWFSPETYAHLLESAHYGIGAFGGMFLLMVGIKYFIDASKDIHWIEVLEKRLSRWGHIESIEIALALSALLMIALAVTPTEKATVLVAGIAGITLFIVIEGIASAFSVNPGGAARQSATLFVYLNVLDSAFSLDGVIGAFAITSQIIIIAVGLGIGAYFVRTLTVMLVRRKTLETLTYLEHGAHWAIVGLALSMLAGLIWHIPESVVALVGIAFVCASYVSSLRERRAAQITG